MVRGYAHAHVLYAAAFPHHRHPELVHPLPNRLQADHGAGRLPPAAGHIRFRRLFRIRSPFPLLAAGFALAFLHDQLLDLRGQHLEHVGFYEFGYSISFALVFIFLGTLHRGLERSRYDRLFAVNGLILMSLGAVAHRIFTIALCIVAPSLLLLHRRWRAVGYMAAAFGLGFCLTAWGLPSWTRSTWVANVDWVPLKAFKDLLPPEIRFIAAHGVLGMASP